MNPLNQLKRATPVVVVASVLVCLALSPRAQAVTPGPDGGYLGGNPAERDDALFSATNGTDNTALGYRAFYYDSGGNGNTAIGTSALQNNSTRSYNAK